MSVDLGDRTEDSLIYFMWSTNAADGSSITRATDGAISVYKNDDLSQSVAGVTDTEDFDSLTGIHLCKIDTSADAFYATAEDYTVVLSGATIDGKSVNAVLAVFSIENRFMQGTDSAALAATALTDVMWTDAKAGALTDWLNGGRLDAILDLCAVEATIEGHVNTCLSAYNGPTDAEMLAAFTEIKGATWAPGTDTLEHIRNRGDSAWTTATGFNTVTPDAAGTAATPAEVATALTDLHLDHLLAADYDPASKPGVATALLNELVENDGGTARYTANALEQAPSGGTNPNVLIDTTIATVTDQTHIILTAGSADNDAYKNQAVVVYDASVSDYPSVRKVAGYVGSTKTITLDSAPDFTMVNGDGCRVFVTAPGTTSATVGEIRTEMEGVGTKLTLALEDTADLQGNQGAWATATGFNTVTPDAAGVAPTAAEIKTAIEAAGSHLALILADTDTTIPAQIAALNDTTVADIIAGISDGTLDLQEMIRIILSATAGKSSGGGTATVAFRDAADNKARITATIDANGNRTAMTLDGA